MTRRAQVRFVSPDEYEEIIEIIERAPRGTFSGWFPDVLRTYWATGARPAEIVGKNARVGLRWEDGTCRMPAVREHHGLRSRDVLEGEMLFIEGKNSTPKNTGLKPRTVICAVEDTYRMLRERAASVRPKDHLFGLGPARSRYRDGYQQLNREVHKLRGLLPTKFSDFQIRWLRHAWAINALRAGIDLVTIQRQLGHSDIAITANYLKFVPTDRARVVAAFSGKGTSSVEARDCPACGFQWQVDTKTGAIDASDRAGAILKRHRR